MSKFYIARTTCPLPDERGIEGARRFLFGVFDGLQAQRRVTFHDGKLFGLITTGFEQDPIRNANFADVMKRGRLEQHGDGVIIESGGKMRVLP